MKAKPISDQEATRLAELIESGKEVSLQGMSAADKDRVGAAQRTIQERQARQDDSKPEEDTSPPPKI